VGSSVGMALDLWVLVCRVLWYVFAGMLGRWLVLLDFFFVCSFFFLSYFSFLEAAREFRTLDLLIHGALVAMVVKVVGGGGGGGKVLGSNPRASPPTHICARFVSSLKL
jgi:hypothetical protein